MKLKKFLVRPPIIPSSASSCRRSIGKITLISRSASSCGYFNWWMIKSGCRALDGTRRKVKSPNGWQTSMGRSDFTCTRQELIRVTRDSFSGFDKRAKAIWSAFVTMEPGYRWLIVCHKPGRNCWPDSLGSCFWLSAASVMNPLSRFSNEVEVQVKIEQGQRGFIFLHRLLDEISVGGLILEEDLHRLNPRLVDLLLAHF